MTSGITFLFFRCTVSIRDLLSWVNFINVTARISSTEMETDCSDSQYLEPVQSYLHGAFLVFLDALGAGTLSNGDKSKLLWTVIHFRDN